jgi:acyl phosphate:glycerol-3-phosphate acyltransferase
MLTMVIKVVLAIAAAYLLGSIPFAYIVTRLTKGTDIRQIGTRNVGAMNTMRHIGLLHGAAVLILDMAKGSLAVLLPQLLGLQSIFVFICGLAAVTGHSWPVFLGFKGGKGLATTLGILVILVPVEFGICCVVMVPIFLFTRNSSLAAGVGLIILPLVIWAFGKDLGFIVYPLILGAFLIFRNVFTFRRDLAVSGSIKTLVFRKNPALWRKGKG